MPLLAFQNVSVGYGAIKAIHHVSLEVFQGEIIALIGANGAGKSTLLMSVFGSPKIQSGQILYKEEPIQSLLPHHVSKLGIAIVPERRRIFTKMSTQENLLMGALWLKEKQIQSNIERVFSLFPILKMRRHLRAGILSGGEQQMLSLGRALMSDPSMLLIDEPSLGLAPTLSKRIVKTLKEIAAAGCTILLVEQNAYLALQIANRAYILVNGEIVKTGSGKELLEDPMIQSAYLGSD